MEKFYDVIIIGGGSAGLTAAIYASRMRMKTLVLESNAPGGRVVEAPFIENFPGFPEGISGIDLMERMIKQAENFGAEMKFPEEVLDMNLSGIIKSVTTRHGEYHGFSVIIATGTQRKKLTVPGEVEFLGRGVSYCAICDAPFFKDKEVVVVGFNNEALEDALYISTFAEKVTVVTQNESGRADVEKNLLKNCRERGNIKFKESKIKSINGDLYVKSVTLINPDGKEETVSVDGVFIVLGNVPLTDIVKKAGVTVDERNCIKVDRSQSTNIDGVYAAGDCTCGGMQVATAVGEGAMAALQAYRYVRRVKK